MEAGPYLQTVSGRRVNPFDPDPEQLDIEDIARALANLCRFGGHSRVFYSVAQHSVIVSELVEQRGGDAEDWHWPELEGIEPLDLELKAWPPDEAARVFAQRYAELDARR